MVKLEHQFIDTPWFQTSGRKQLSLWVGEESTEKAHRDSDDSTSVATAVRRSILQRFDGSFGRVDSIDRNYAERRASKQRSERRSSASGHERRSSAAGHESKLAAAQRRSREQAHESAYTSTARESGWDPDAEPPPRIHKAASFIQAAARARQRRLKARGGATHSFKSLADTVARMLDKFGCGC